MLVLLMGLSEIEVFVLLKYWIELMCVGVLIFIDNICVLLFIVLG